MSKDQNEDVVPLSGEPRQDSAGGAYYAIPGCEGLLQQLVHLLRFGEGLPVVQAGRSAGKTTMARELQNRLSECPWLSLVSCDLDQDLAGLLQQITDGLELRGGAGAGENLAVLRQFSTGLASNRELAVLILDDVHLLDNQSLGAVVSLLQGSNFPGYGLHLVFFAAPGLVERVDEIGLLESPVYDFEIPLFSPSELSGFLKSRFPGAQQSASSVQNIWAQSLGSPGVAINLFENSLDETGEGTGASVLLGSLPKGHFVALAVLIAVLVWAIFARESTRHEGALEAERESLETVDVSPLPERTPLVSGSEQETVLDPELAEGELEQLKAEIVKTELEKTARELSINTEEEGSDIEDGQTQAGSISGPEPVKSVELIVSEPKITEIPPETTEKLPRKPVIRSDNQEMSARSQGALGMSADELFLMDQPPEAFTLQILAASRPGALKGFIEKQPNKADLYLYQALREGKVWFVVVTGVFASRSDAQQAISMLPEKQKKTGPWPRQLSGIQSEIAAFRSK